MKYVTDAVSGPGNSYYLGTYCYNKETQSRSGCIQKRSKNEHPETEIDTTGTFCLSVESTCIISSDSQGISAYSSAPDHPLSLIHEVRTGLSYKHTLSDGVLFSCSTQGAYAEVDMEKLGLTKYARSSCTGNSPCVHEVLSIYTSRNLIWTGCDAGVIQVADRRVGETVFSQEMEIPGDGITMISEIQGQKGITVGTYMGQLLTFPQTNPSVPSTSPRNLSGAIWSILPIPALNGQQHYAIAQTYGGIAICNNQMQRVASLPTADLVYSIRVSNRGRNGNINGGPEIVGYEYYTGKEIRAFLGDLLRA